MVVRRTAVAIAAMGAAMGAAIALASCADVLGLKDFELETAEGGPGGGSDGGDAGSVGRDGAPSDGVAPDGGGGPADADEDVVADGSMPAADAPAESAPEAAVDAPLEPDVVQPVDAPADVPEDVPTGPPKDAPADVPPDVPCVGSMTDARNCGTCGHDCEGGGCFDGACQPFPLSGAVDAFDMVSDGTTVYWVDGKTSGMVGRCGVSACTPTPVVSAQPMPIRIALDSAGQPIWSQFGSGTTTDGSVWTLAGSTPTPVATHRFAPQGVTADATYFYWAELDANQLVRAARAGGMPGTFGPPQMGPVSIVLDTAGFAYWTASNDGTVNRCPVASCTAAMTKAIVMGQTSPWGLAIDAGYLYFTDLQSTGRVVRCNHDGTGQMQLGGGSQSNPLRIVSDGVHVYWTNQGSGANTGSVMACTGATCAPIATGLATPAGIAVDAKAVYYSTEGDTTLWKVVK